jgi:hypothetical protein
LYPALVSVSKYIWCKKGSSSISNIFSFCIIIIVAFFRNLRTIY